jgi:hypothetical protein
MNLLKPLSMTVTAEETAALPAGCLPFPHEMTMTAMTAAARRRRRFMIYFFQVVQTAVISARSLAT